MKIAFFVNIVSPHQLPLAREVARRVGDDNFVYVYTEPFHAERAKLGWNANDLPKWCVQGDENTSLLIEADVVYTGLRCFDLMAKRSALGKTTLYCSERWFKPPVGWLRMLVPSYFKMARRFVRQVKNDPNFHVLPIGVHARRDFARMGIPEAKMTTWGYFVAPSTCNRDGKIHCPPPPSTSTASHPTRILWVGRMLKLKNVDVIIKAFQNLDPGRFSLTLVGDGPERGHLIRMAQGMSNVCFRDSVPIAQVRELMRSHDIFVFPSNGYDGWGAVVSEAMEEGMVVLGSDEAGASATMLPPTHRFDCRDHKRLFLLLEDVASGRLKRVPIGEWTAEKAASKLVAFEPNLDRE